MRRKVKNVILKSITVIAFFAWGITACAMDSENINVLLIINFLSLAWLFLMALANGEVII